MKSSHRLAISVPEGRPIKPLVKAVLIYENFASGVRARWFCEKFVRLLDVRLEETNWSFDALGISEIRVAAAGAARKADVVMLSVSGRKKLPGIVKTWLDMWLWLLDSEDPAFVALFDASAPQHTLSIRAYVSSAAREAGIDFFSHELAASELPQFLGGESRLGTAAAAKPEGFFPPPERSLSARQREKTMRC
jgi:hypothetical protein